MSAFEYGSPLRPGYPPLGDDNYDNDDRPTAKRDIWDDFGDFLPVIVILAFVGLIALLFWLDLRR